MASKWIPEVQGVRTLALALVAAYHIWFGKVSGGVDVFLFISAFLLTRSMIESAERGERARPFSTILRRFARLLPLTLTAVLLIVAASLLWLPTSETPMILTQGFASSTYWENIYLQGQQIDYFAADRSTASPFQHYWSLAVQGQVFVLWPLLFALLWLVAKVTKLDTRKVALGGFGLVLVLGFAFSVRYTEVNQQAAYFDMFARLWEFAAGSVLALVMPWLRVPVALRVVFGWLGVIGIVLCGWVLPVEASFPGWAALWPILSAALVVMSAGAGRFGAGVLLNNDFMQQAAKYSFALYLTHWPVLVVYLFVARVDEVSFIVGAGLLGVSFALAWVLTRFVESPISDYLGGRRTPVIGGWFAGLGRLGRAAVVVIALPVITLGTLGLGQAQLASATTQARAEADALDLGSFGASTPDLVGTESAQGGTLQPSELLVRDDLAMLPDCDDATLDAIDEDLHEYCMGTNDADTWVVGNSQAQQSLPLLDGDVQAFIFFGCQFGGEGVEPDIEEECNEFWDAATEQLLESRPERVLVMATRSYANDSENELPGIEEWITMMRDAGIEVIAVRDAPRASFNPFMCTEQWGIDADRCAFSTSLAAPNENLQARCSSRERPTLTATPSSAPTACARRCAAASTCSWIRATSRRRTFAP
ncbi:acyltransferase family protein [Gulosibacter faecalis]|uniref:acyltransferase family protein n=1 Tax=Gulosibacter faecalis TaxID=272240 RepID=UPI0003AA9637|nr:acyltransferase family protein [Gulosibacter faecalis]